MNFICKTTMFIKGGSSQTFGGGGGEGGGGLRLTPVEKRHQLRKGGGLRFEVIKYFVGAKGVNLDGEGGYSRTPPSLYPALNICIYLLIPYEITRKKIKTLYVNDFIDD